MHLKQIIDDLHESHDNKDFAYAHIYTHTHMYGKMDVYVWCNSSSTYAWLLPLNILIT